MNKEQSLTLELFAEELPTQVEMTATPMGTWSSATTLASASCPYSSASSFTSASSAG